MDESNETGDVGGVENYNEEFCVGTIFLDVLSEFFCYFGVAGEEVFAGHTLFTGCAARRDDVFCTGESFGCIGSACDVYIIEAALTHFLSNAFCAEYVVEADVGSEVHHARCLSHVRANHTGCAHDDKFVVCKKIHNEVCFYVVSVFTINAFRLQVFVPRRYFSQK